MKRLILAGLLLAAGVGGVLVWTAVSEERDYRRLIAEGNAALMNGRTFLAIEAFTGALTLKPGAMLGHLRRGETYRRRGEFGAALRDLRTAAALDPTATRPLEQLGDVNAALGQHVAAESSYADYLRLDDDAPRVLYKLGLARYRNGDAAAAIPVLERAADLDGDLADAHLALGLALRARDRPEAALAALRRAVALAPADTEARLELVDVLFALGLQEERIDQLEALAALDPEHPQHQVTLGLAYAEAGRTDLAVLTLGRAAERYPNQPHFYVALGRIWLELAEREGDPVALGKANEALDPTIVEAVNTSDAHVLRGRVLLLTEDLTGAEAAFVTATQTFPIAPDAYYQLGLLTQRSGRLAEAREAFVLHDTLASHALSDSLRAAGARRLGALSRRLNDVDSEASWLQLAADLGNSNASLWQRVADAHARAGDQPAARRAALRGLELKPDNQLLRALLERFRPPPSP